MPNNKDIDVTRLSSCCHGGNEIFPRRTLIEAGLPTRPGEIQYASVYLRMRQITARFVVPS